MRQRRWIELFSDYECEIRYHPGKANVVADALSRKERVKPKRVRAMAMTIQSGVKGMILAAQGEAFNQENVLAERLHGLDQQMERKGDGSLYFMDRIWVPLVGGVRIVIMDEAHKSRFTSRLWQTFQKALGTQLDMSMAYHPQTDGQSERTIQTLEDMLRACVIEFGGSWDVHLPSPMLWAKIREGSLIGPELVQETTHKVVVIKEKLQAARDRRKSYADSGRKMTEYEVRENVLLKVSPWKGVMRFGKKEVLRNANFHVSLNEIKIDKTLRFVEEPVEIMDREVKSLKRSRIPLVKVRWDSKCGLEFTWEHEDYMKSKYPQLFVDCAVEPTSEISRRDFHKEGIL
ncbi:putative reverse transcriptase domain-containing protein [Tanacetum coccineum]